MKNTKKGFIDLVAVLAVAGLLGSGYYISTTDIGTKKVDEKKIENFKNTKK